MDNTVKNTEIKKLTISVRQTDILYGKKFNCESCPIALAVKRIWAGNGEKISVQIDSFSCRIFALSEEWLATLSEKTRAFVINFDNNPDTTKVQPITFDLEFYKIYPVVKDFLHG